MQSMRILHRLLALACEWEKDRTTGSVIVCTLCTIVHCLFSKAPECMMLKVSSRSPVLGILIAVYTSCYCLAFLSGTREKVTQPAIMILNRDVIRLEEGIDVWMPGLLDSSYIKWFNNKPNCLEHGHTEFCFGVHFIVIAILQVFIWVEWYKGRWLRDQAFIYY